MPLQPHQKPPGPASAKTAPQRRIGSAVTPPFPQRKTKTRRQDQHTQRNPIFGLHEQIPLWGLVDSLTAKKSPAHQYPCHPTSARDKTGPQFAPEVCVRTSIRDTVFQLPEVAIICPLVRTADITVHRIILRPEGKSAEPDESVRSRRHRRRTGGTRTILHPRRLPMKGKIIVESQQQQALKMQVVLRRQLLQMCTADPRGVNTVCAPAELVRNASANAIFRASKPPKNSTPRLDPYRPAASCRASHSPR